eukprot:scaffold26609_cov59-Phaeocystis_antarctica.AAC.5
MSASSRGGCVRARRAYVGGGLSAPARRKGGDDLRLDGCSEGRGHGRKDFPWVGRLQRVHVPIRRHGRVAPLGQIVKP